MKTCPVCALDLEDSYLFCPDDGSILSSFSKQTTESQVASASGSADETAGAVVLYCPACAAEYPLTFSACPVHAVQLTKHRIPRSGLRSRGIGAQATIAGPHFDRDQPGPANPPTGLDVIGSRIESTNHVDASEIADSSSPAAQHVTVIASGSPPYEPYSAAPVGAAFEYKGSLTGEPEGRPEHPGLRVAAIATGIALAVFGLVVIKTLVSRSSSRAIKIASSAQEAPRSLPFVPTPQEARDYKEQEAIPTSSPELSSVRSVDRLRNENPSPLQLRNLGHKAETTHPVGDATIVPSPAATAPIPRVANQPLPPLPRGNSGGFDARLIRVRSRKTPDGFRYDLTFNMQEQTGRSAQWQRVLISTRSANGTSHTEAIPFSHRLGAAGALTFTISVELTGRSEADWQGRILCTTLGWDNKGAPLQSSFGANVAP
jgi:hypothetical protein